MNRDVFKSWLDALGSAWVNLDPAAAGLICADDVRYYEKLFHQPLKSPAEVKEQWRGDLEYQKDVKVDTEIIAIEGNVGVARFWATFTVINPNDKSEKKYTCDGIFLVELNEQGLCRKFEQWPIYKD